MIIAITDTAGGAQAILSCLAQLRCAHGRKVLTLDAAVPLKAARTMWGAGASRSLRAELEWQLPRYQDIVIDAGRDAGGDCRTALVAARRVLVPLHADQADPERNYQLIARLNAARMFNPGLAVLFVAVSDGTASSPLAQRAMHGYVGQVMAATLAPCTLQLTAPRPDPQWYALYDHVFSH